MQVADLQVGMRLAYVHDARYPSGTGFSQPPQWVACDVVLVNGEGDVPDVHPDNDHTVAVWGEQGDHAIVAKEFVLPRAIELATGQGAVAARRGEVVEEELTFRRGQGLAADDGLETVRPVYVELAEPERMVGLDDGGYRAVMFCLPRPVLAGIPERNGAVRMERPEKVGLGKLRRRGFGRESRASSMGSLF